MANQVQTLTLSATPDSGTVDLQFGDTLLTGITPANLLTPSQIITLLEAASLIFASGVSAAYASLVDTFTFASPVGNYDWPEIVVSSNGLYVASGVGDPAVAEVRNGGGAGYWTLTFTAGSGANTFDIFDGVSDSAPVSDNMDAADIANIIYSAVVVDFGPPANAIVTDATGNSSGTVQPFTILLTGNAATATLSIANDTGAGAAIFSGAQEIQSLTLPGGVTAGSFTLASETITYGQSVAGTVTAADVQAACDAGLGAGVTVVTGSNGGPFTITWQAVGSQSLLTVTDVMASVSVTITTTQVGG
jgi:hypothetical protein